MKNNRYLGALLLLLASLPLTAAPQTLDRIVALVNDDVILQSEYDRTLQRLSQQLAEKGELNVADPAFRRQVMERLISRKVQEQKGKELGIAVDDAELNRSLQQIAAKNGLSLGQFRDALQAEGYAYRDFREDIREEMLLVKVRKRQVEMQTKVSDQEVDDFLALRDRLLQKSYEYRLRHILVAVPPDANVDQLGAAEARSQRVLASLNEGADFASTAMNTSDGQFALEGGDLGWRNLEQLPKVFVEALQGAKPGDVMGPLRSANGFHIIKLEESRGEERHFVEQTHSRHILLRVTEIRDESATLAEIKKLRERLVAGEDFATLAREYSDDPGSGSAGGDLGWYGPGMMVEEFERVSNELAPNELSEPFHSAFGWHIMQVLGRRTEDDTEAFLRDKARERLLQRKIEEESELWVRRLRNEAYVEIRLADLAE